MGRSWVGFGQVLGGFGSGLGLYNKIIGYISQTPFFKAFGVPIVFPIYSKLQVGFRQVLGRFGQVLARFGQVLGRF